jgi:NAD(P)H-nitrite reductase large subunit
MYAFMDIMERRELEPFERAFYDAQNIDRIRDLVVDIDTDSKTLTFASGGSISYDKLLLAVGAKARLFPWEGMDKASDGVAHFVSMQDLDNCERLAATAQKAVVVGGGLIGIELVECLYHHKIPVTFLVREPYYWPIALHSQEGKLVSDHIRSHRGIDLRHEEEMESVEVDENGRVSAIRTNKGDHVPCQMLGICVGVAANVEWIKECGAPIEIGRGICVDRSFRTSAPDIFGAGDCVQIDMGEERPKIETIWYSAKLHGRLAAAAMMGDEIHYTPPLFYNSSKFFEIEYTTVGAVTMAPKGSMSLYRKHPKKTVTQRIIYNPDREVIGFNMLGSRWNHNVLERWIHERRNVDFVCSRLHEAQFDVEFGRAKLHQFNEEELAL